jgi:tetratricopeptide (TPR) repeat protein
MIHKLSATQRRRYGVVGAILVALLIPGCKRGSSEIPELSKRSSYSKIFQQNDRAEAKTDPLERCLSYPSPPHLPWPESLTSALCADLHTPVMQAADIKPLIDKGDWKALRDRYAAYLERHYSGADPEKLLYRVFPENSWKNQKEADSYTRKWVAAQPDDPFANTARGTFLMSAAWDARGTGYFKEVPDAKKREMYRHALEATVHLRKAITAEPKLMPAYRQLIDAYALGGKSEWIPAAVRAATRQSPSTFYVRSIAANYYQRKWGGSESDMNALIADAERHLKQNPRLAMIRTDSERELGDAASDNKKYRSALAQYRRALAHGPDNTALLNAAYVAPKLGYHAEKIVYLTQDIRFSKDGRDSLLKRGAIWESDGDFRRAMNDYQAAKKLYPLDAEIDERIAAAKEREKNFGDRKRP